MSAPTQASPFAALTLKEQQEKWIVWQNQHMQQQQLFIPEETPLPPLRLPCPSDAECSRPPAREANIPLPPVRRSQYDAVLRRMDQAGRKTGAWQSVT